MLKGEGKFFDWLALVKATRKANRRLKSKAHGKADRKASIARAIR